MGVRIVYPDSWEVLKLGEIAESEKGKKPKNESSEQSEVHQFPYIDIEAFEKLNFKSFTDGEKCVFCDEDDFLMVWDGSRSGLVGKGIKGVLGSTLVRIKLPKMNNHYAYYFLQSKYLEINTRAKGSGTPHVDPDLLWNYDFPIPPINEQNRIVEKIETLFSEIDAGVESLSKAKIQLERYRQSLLKHAFEGKLTAQWRAEFESKNGKPLPTADELIEQIQTARQAHYDKQIKDWELAVKAWENNGKNGKKPTKPTKLEKFQNFEKNDLIPDFPETWALIKLSDIAEIGSGISVSQNRKLNNPLTVNYLRVANVQRGYLVLDEIKTMKIEEELLSKYSLKYGDILFNEGGDRDKLGRGWIWQSEIENCITQNHVFRATPHIASIVHSKYISYWGNSFGKNYFEKTGKQTTNLASINKTVLSGFPVTFPSLNEQSIIVDIIESRMSEIDNLMSQLESQLLKANYMKSAILHKAFQGKLVPQDPTDLPASQLLDQIKAERLAKQTAKQTAQTATKSKAKANKQPKAKSKAKTKES